MKAADARNLIIAQIETERGLEVVEDIAAVEGIDAHDANLPRALPQGNLSLDLIH